MEEPTGKIEYYEKRFGMIAIEKGFITIDDLLKALSIQINENLKKERHRLIGEILLEMDIMTADQIEAVARDIFR
jgi:predicted N-acyltransferase